MPPILVGRIAASPAVPGIKTRRAQILSPTTNLPYLSPTPRLRTNAQLAAVPPGQPPTATPHTQVPSLQRLRSMTPSRFTPGRVTISTPGRVAGEAARVAAESLGATLVPVGTVVAVYWVGCDDWYEAVVAGHS